MEVKLGDIIYNKNEERWHDNSFPGDWHNIKKYQGFEVISIGPSGHGYGKRVTIRNINENYNIYMNYLDLEDDFYTKKDIRNIKLKAIGKEN